MDSALFLQIVTVISDLIIFLFVGFYLYSLTKDRKTLNEREEKLKKKEADIEAHYNQIIEEAQNEKKRMLQEASQKVNAIINETQFVTESTKKQIQESLGNIVTNIEKEASEVSQKHVNTYRDYLNKASQSSLQDFQKVAKRFETEMEKETQDFRSQLLAKLQKELEDYKNRKIKESEVKVNEVIEKVAQEVFNKSISTEEHKKLIMDSLERAEKEGVFGQ